MKPHPNILKSINPGSQVPKKGQGRIANTSLRSLKRQGGDKPTPGAVYIDRTKNGCPHKIR